MTLGERLARLRNQKGLSQDALAEALGVSRQSVSKWETDASIPELDKLVRLSGLFGVSLDELVSGSSPAVPAPSSHIGTVWKRFAALYREKAYLLGWLLVVWGGTWAVTFHTDRFLSPCQNRLGRHREIFTDDLLFLYFSYSENCAWIVGRFPWSAFFRSIPVVLPGMAAYCFGRVWLSSDPASAVKSAGRPAGCLSGIPAILWPC